MTLPMSFTEVAPVSAQNALQIAGASAFIIIGYLTVVMVMRVGDIGLIAPFRYTSLLFAIVLGVLVFGEWPDMWTWTGSALVVGAGLYTILRERRLKG